MSRGRPRKLPKREDVLAEIDGRPVPRRSRPAAAPAPEAPADTASDLLPDADDVAELVDLDGGRDEVLAEALDAYRDAFEQFD